MTPSTCKGAQCHKSLNTSKLLCALNHLKELITFIKDGTVSQPLFLFVVSSYRVMGFWAQWCIYSSCHFGCSQQHQGERSGLITFVGRRFTCSPTRTTIPHSHPSNDQEMMSGTSFARKSCSSNRANHTLSRHFWKIKGIFNMIYIYRDPSRKVNTLS